MLAIYERNLPAFVKLFRRNSVAILGLFRPVSSLKNEMLFDEHKLYETIISQQEYWIKLLFILTYRRLPFS